MRKYRGLTTTKTKGWSFGYYCQVEGKHFIIPNDAELAVTVPDCKFMDAISGMVEVGPETVGQYINCHDKTNKEIYIGDIVKAKYEDLLGIEREVIGVVDLNDFHIILDFPNYGISVPMAHFYTDEPDDFEIIGDIHSNPDLLEQGQ